MIVFVWEGWLTIESGGLDLGEIWVFCWTLLEKNEFVT